MKAMPSIGGTPDAEASIAMCGASAAEIHAISANVGAAAKPNQLPASKACQTRVLRFIAIVDAFISRQSDRISPFRALQNWTRIYG